MQAKIQSTRDQISHLEVSGAPPALPRPGVNPMAYGASGVFQSRAAKGAQIDISTQTRDLVTFQSELRHIEEHQGDLSVASTQVASDKKDAADKAAQSKAEHRAQSDFAVREWRIKQFEEQLNATMAARDKEIAAEKHYDEQLEEQQQRWTKINLDEQRSRNKNNIREAKIDIPLGARLPANLDIGMALAKSGVKTAQVREGEIAESQRLLNMAEAVNVPLGTQLRMREQILQEQIALKEEQGQSVSQELQALDALQAQMDRMRQKSAGIAPMLHELRQIGGGIPDKLGGALAGGLVSGSPGKVIGQEIRGALQGIGHQILGTVFRAAITQLITAMGANAAVISLLSGVVSGATLATVGNTIATEANTIWLAVKSFLGFAADGGNIAGPTIVGERGPELFIPDGSGKVVPNHMLGGYGGSLPNPGPSLSSSSIGSMNFHAHGMTNPREFVREEARQLPAYLKSTNPKYSPAAR